MRSGFTTFAALATCAALTGQAQADLVGYVDNETGNSADWTNGVNGLGGLINTDMDFETHPLGPLDPNHYSGLGVTLTGVNFNDVIFGAGPGQGNDFTEPLSDGEGLHPASNYLEAPATAGSLTISFDAPVLGVGFFTVDLFNPNNVNPVTIEAYDGPNGTGNFLGSYAGAGFNFQKNNLYFMGVTSSAVDIRSLVFVNPAGAGDRVGIDNIVFATVPSPGLLPAFAVAGLLGSRRRRRA